MSNFWKNHFWYTGWPPKKQNSRFFRTIALINSYIFSPCWIEHLFLIIITPLIIKFGWKLWILWAQFLDGLSFSGFAINFSLTGWPPKKRNSKFFRTLLWWTVILFTLLDRASFPQDNDTKISKFGWKLFILWVISYRLSFLGFAINLSSCLETLEIGQITKMTVHKKCLIK